MKNYQEILQKKQDKKNFFELKKLDTLNLKKFKKFGKINLLSLSIFEIQRYLSSTIINKTKESYNKEIQPPYANSEYLNFSKNYPQKNKKIFDYIKSLKFKITNVMPLFHISSFRAQSPMFTQIERYLSKKRINIRRINFHPIYIKNLNEQFKILETYLIKFAKVNNIKNKYFVKNILEYLKKFFSSKKIKINYSDYLFVGSNANIESRIMSAQYLLENRKVISVNHANFNTFIYDEPQIEFGDYSFCDFFIDFGSLKFKKEKLKSNYLHPKKIISLSSPKIEDKIINTNNASNKNIIYLPDSFHGDYRTGPHREMDDLRYYSVQKKIINFNNKILIKKHPKELQEHLIKKNTIYKKLKFKKNKITKYRLDYLLSNYKLFIIDRISQSFFEIAKTNAKILYMNMGRRKIRKEILKLIKNRAHVVNINPDNLKKKELNNYIRKAANFKIKNYKILKKCNLSKNNITKELDKIIKF